MTLKELRDEAKARKIPNWWNKNTQELTEELGLSGNIDIQPEEAAETPAPETPVEVPVEKASETPAPVSEEPKPETEDKSVEKAKDVEKREKCVVRGDIPLTKWCKDHNLPYFTIYDRIHRLGWDVEKAITTPVRPKK